jgi:CRP/FNR family cyclic AMP-dependent transcriptional regulator
MSELSEFLKYVPIFSELPDDAIERISKIGYVKNFDKESIILMEDEDGSAMFFIIEGKVKITRISSDGKEVILSVLGKSEFFGEMAILDGLSRSATVIALEPSKLFIIHRNEFLELLTKHPEISIPLLQELTSRLRTADMKIKSLSLKDAEGKVATVVLQLADTQGKVRGGIVEIDEMPLQQDLANMAGTSRETISRTLHAFAKKGIIEMEGSKLRIIDYEKFMEQYG